MAKQLISSSETKSVYRDGSTAIKEFCEGFPKAEVLNEALCNARVETIEVLNVPKVLGVSVIDGKWSITREFVEGKTPSAADGRKSRQDRGVSGADG